MFGDLITNVLSQVVNNTWNIVATVSLYRMYENARNNQLTWRNTIKVTYYCTITVENNNGIINRRYEECQSTNL